MNAKLFNNDLVAVHPNGACNGLSSQLGPNFVIELPDQTMPFMAATTPDPIYSALEISEAP